MPNEYPAPDQDVIGFRNASFVWSRDSLEDEVGQRNFTLRVEGEVVFKRGSLNLIVGPTGSGLCLFRGLGKSVTLTLLMIFLSGKTSLLMALLSEPELCLWDYDAVILILTCAGEMHFIPLANNSWYRLPRTGGVSYAAQESWVQNETIRVSICNYCRFTSI